VHSNVFPRVIGRSLPRAEHAEGAVIWDESGKAYIDAAGGAVVVGIGHGDTEVIAALAEQAHRVAYCHGTQFTSDALESYANQVAPLLPVEDARIYPVSGGSEAVETAFKMARAYHLARGESTRFRVIARKHSYHGNSLNALDASGRRILRRPYEPWLGRARHIDTPHEYRCTFEEHDRCGERHAEVLDEAIEREGPETVACFIAEPVVGAAMGAVVPPPDYWSAVQNVCRKHGVLLIADEVMTGFGRTGRWFGCDHWGVQPDIMTAGKGVSSGYWPFGFAACSKAVFDAISTTGFTHGFTFSHSAVGAAVASAVLRRLTQGDLVNASRRKGDRLRSELASALSDHPHVGEVRGLGLMLGVEFVADRKTRQPFPRTELVTEKILGAAKQRGLLLYPSTGGANGNDGDTAMLGPPFVITDDELGVVVERLCAAVEAVIGW
jgi:adenosylmethionine-8-amino-7-oxononanoate aminotransferase